MAFSDTEGDGGAWREVGVEWEDGVLLLQGEGTGSGELESADEVEL